MNRQALRERVLSEYGLSGDATADGLFTDTILNDCISEEHRELAAELLCYREEQTYDIPLSSGGISKVDLSCNVIKLCLPQQVRFLNSGTWKRLVPITERAALSAVGALDSRVAATPMAYYMRTGNLPDALRQIVLYPGSDLAITGGLQLAAYIYPGLMTADNQTIGLQPAEQRVLINRICFRMAKMERASGRPDAPVQMFYDLMQEQTRGLKRIVQAARRTGNRAIRVSNW